MKSVKPKICITGATGFVGSHFAQAYCDDGIVVRGIRHVRPAPIKNTCISWVSADLNNQADCCKAVRGCTTVLHAAGAISGVGGLASPVHGIAVNLALTAQVIDACVSEGVEKVLLFSSSTGYPIRTKPVTEKDFWGGDVFPAYEGYGWMRRYFERLAQFVTKSSATKVYVARPGAIYGPRDSFDEKSSHVVAALIRKAVSQTDPFEVWGTGDEVRDFLYITDFVAGCRALLEKGVPAQPINIAAGKKYTIRELTEAVLSASGHNPKKVLYNCSKPTAIPYRAIDISAARKVLGYKPQVSLKDGLEKTISWYAKPPNPPGGGLC